uniref:Uncharacterized protein n=1 Tax=Cacopsylla melanoneura TaxID=428564 RepID=A0A8D8WXM4_9HEMI
MKSNCVLLVLILSVILYLGPANANQVIDHKNLDGSRTVHSLNQLKSISDTDTYSRGLSFPSSASKVSSPYRSLGDIIPSSEKIEYEFNLRECVRTVAKIELLQDAYENIMDQLGPLFKTITVLIHESFKCRWPVNYFECLNASFKTSKVAYVVSHIGDVLYGVLRVLEAMFIGAFRCFTRYYF